EQTIPQDSDSVKQIRNWKRFKGKCGQQALKLKHEVSRPSPRVSARLEGLVIVPHVWYNDRADSVTTQGRVELNSQKQHAVGSPHKSPIYKGVTSMPQTPPLL